MSERVSAPVRTGARVGRPTLFTDDLFADIMGRLAGGESLRAICRDGGMPGRSTVRGWIAGSADLRHAYGLAIEFRADAIFDDILDIADDGRGDWVEKRNGELTLDAENVRRAELRIDARKWALARMAPKRYGDGRSTPDDNRITVVIRDETRP